MRQTQFTKVLSGIILCTGFQQAASAQVSYGENDKGQQVRYDPWYTVPLFQEQDNENPLPENLGTVAATLLTPKPDLEALTDAVISVLHTGVGFIAYGGSQGQGKATAFFKNPFISVLENSMTGSIRCRVDVVGRYAVLPNFHATQLVTDLIIRAAPGEPKRLEEISFRLESGNYTNYEGKEWLKKREAPLLLYEIIIREGDREAALPKEEHECGSVWPVLTVKARRLELESEVPDATGYYRLKEVPLPEIVLKKVLSDDDIWLNVNTLYLLTESSVLNPLFQCVRPPMH